MAQSALAQHWRIVLSSNAPNAAEPAAAMQRSRGGLRVGIGAPSRLTDLFQDGAMRARLPRALPGAPLEVVVINTAGGMTGGDRYEIAIDVEAGAVGTLVGQACEKLYRSSGGDAVLDVRLRIAEGGQLHWLPQPAILFDGSAFRRRLSVELAPGARFFGLEASVLGRAAMGETLSDIRLREDWRVYSDDALVWASATRMNLPGDDLFGTATLGGGNAFASFLCADGDPDAVVERFRAVAEGIHGRMGASRVGGLATATLVAPDSRHLMQDLSTIIHQVTGTAVPRLWHC